MSAFTDAEMKAALPNIMQNIPAEWRGTTFKNSALLGRENFAKAFRNLIISNGLSITAADLIGIGNAEDYLRVASNVSTVLEFVLATEIGYDITQVFSFSSAVMPIIAVLLTASSPVHFYVGDDGSVDPFTSAQIDIFQKLGSELYIHHGVPQAHPGEVVLASHYGEGEFTAGSADATLFSGLLYIHNTTKIIPSEILRMRKRMCTPMTTPAALALLQAKAGMEVTIDTVTASDEDIACLYAHLQTLSGTGTMTEHNPVCFTAGLPAICSLWMTLVARGGADVVMASTAYGGSSELTDIFQTRTSQFRKHTFDITGTKDLSLAIQATLDEMASSAATQHTALLPTTVLFVEIPTNPDMKVAPIEVLAEILARYQTSTGKKVLLLVDTTFAPSSKVLQNVDPALTALAFISLSKSVSRGMSTGGALIANDGLQSYSLLADVRDMAVMLDTTSRRDQMVILCKEHINVETRNSDAYAVASAVGSALCDAVFTHCGGVKMPLAFVTPADAAAGFTSSTFSFNLPHFDGKSPEVNEALAQKFVDLLTIHEQFKPCVSFGQDNGLVYATVPATSTQGAIKAEDKAKQAVGGVQLVRLSFPPTCDVDAVCNIICNAVQTCYNPIQHK